LKADAAVGEVATWRAPGLRAICVIFQDGSTTKGIHRMRNRWEESQKIAFFAAVGVAGGVGTGVGVGIAAVTELSPVLTGLLAGSLSASLGIASIMVVFRVVGD
jgi:hypothetical protein